MNQLTLRRTGMAVVAISSVIGLAASSVSAATTPPPTNNASSSATLKQIISKGDTEISRRLKTLGTLNAQITSSTKLTAVDQSTLSDEVNNEVSGLTALKTKLDADTTVADAKTDAQSIFNDYRVYYLVVPKVWLVKTADDQQVAEASLSALATKIQNDITLDQNAGKNVAGLQAKLTDMNTKIQSAQSISSGMESKVIGLQPTDYNNDHTVLSGDRDQLKTAQGDISTAVSDAKSLIGSLRTL